MLFIDGETADNKQLYYLPIDGERATHSLPVVNALSYRALLVITVLWVECYLLSSGAST